MKNDTQDNLDRAKAIAFGGSETVGEVVGEITGLMLRCKLINTPASRALYDILDHARSPYLDVEAWSPDEPAPEELKLAALSVGLLPIALLGGEVTS